MAIERMKSLWLFARRGAARDLLERLATTGLVHVADCGLADSEGHEALGVERVFPEAGDIQQRVRLLDETLQILSRFHTSRRALLENFITTPLEVSQAEVRQVLRELDPASLHSEVKAAEAELTRLTGLLQKARENLKALHDLEGVEGLLPGRRDQRYTATFLGVMLRQRYESLLKDERLPEPSALSVAASRNRQCVVEAACPADAGEEMLALLHEYGCRTVDPEERTVSIADYLAHRREEVKRLQAEAAEAKKNLTELARRERRRVELALGYWEERARIVEAAPLLAESKRLTVVRAYVRARDLPHFEQRAVAALPDVAVDVRDPAPAEAVPVSLRNRGVLAATQFLVQLFGVPNYFTFDPTPYITLSFLIFFGFCFGDVVYGVGLIAAGWLLARKYREYPGIRGLFSLLAVAGIPTIIVGVLTGAWASDLFTAEYLGEGNPLVRLRGSLMIGDMTDKAMAALAIALLMGVANQFLSLVCLMIRNARTGDVRAAVFDGGFWILVLPAVVIGAASLFVSVPPALSKTAFAAAGIGAAGLILTQGRNEKSLIGKAVVGVVSLYGIVGSYGITAFIGDVLSYSRLLALGLTTSIVGMCFNLIAGMMRAIPIVGIIGMLLVLALGHSMNFVISILGAFVHSARLIFVEFFGKFYQADAVPFRPLGAWTGRIRVTDHPTVWLEEEVGESGGR